MKNICFYPFSFRLSSFFIMICRKLFRRWIVFYPLKNIIFFTHFLFVIQFFIKICRELFMRWIVGPLRTEPAKWPDQTSHLSSLGLEQKRGSERQKYCQKLWRNPYLRLGETENINQDLRNTVWDQTFPSSVQFGSGKKEVALDHTCKMVFRIKLVFN